MPSCKDKSSYYIELCDSEDIYEKLEKLNSNIIMEMVEFEHNSKCKLADIKEYFSDRKIDYYIKASETEVVRKVQIIAEKVGGKKQNPLLSEDKDIEIRKTASKQRRFMNCLQIIGHIPCQTREACRDCNSAVRAMEKGIYKD